MQVIVEYEERIVKQTVIEVDDKFKKLKDIDATYAELVDLKEDLAEIIFPIINDCDNYKELISASDYEDEEIMWEW